MEMMHWSDRRPLLDDRIKLAEYLREHIGGADCARR